MQLLKIRNFSDFFTDTLLFIKENAKHFFTNYFIINGIFLIITLIKHYLTDVGGGFSLTEFVFIIFSFIFGIINWTFVIIYMILYNERGTNFDHRDIIAFYKKNVGKIIIFLLVSMLLALPVIIGFYIVLLISIITIVGPFLVYAALITWWSLALFEYLNTDRAVFDCFGYAFTLLFKKFFAITGSAALLYFIVMIVYGFILGISGLLSAFSGMNTGNSLDKYKMFAESLQSPKVLITMTLLSVLFVVLQVVQGIIYFSQKELLENISAKKSIDEIGNMGNDVQF